MSEKRSLGEKNVTEGVFVLEHLEKINESFVIGKYGALAQISYLLPHFY